MKSVAVLLLLTLIAVDVAIVSSIPRHVNPANVPEEPLFGSYVALLYAKIFNSIGALNLSEAEHLRHVVAEIYLPQNIRYIFERLNEIIDEMINNINTTRCMLSQTRKFIDRGDYIDARILLNAAAKNVIKLKALYDELENVVSRITALGVPKAILLNLQDVAKAIDELEYLVKKYSEILTHRKIIATMISLRVWPSVVWVGESVHVVGTLETVDGIPLANRAVLIHLGGDTHVVSTSSNGSFRFTTVVRVYSNIVKVYAEYVPRNGDKALYSYSRSSTLYIHVLYLKPKLRIQLSKHLVAPGDTVLVKIFSEPPTRIKLVTPFGTRIIGPCSNGTCSITLRVPWNVSEGLYRIKAIALPHGIYGPSSSIAVFRVRRFSPGVKVGIPSVMLTGFTYTIQIRVVPASIVKVYWIKGEIVFRGTDFVKHVSIPYNYMSSTCIFRIFIQPMDPRYKDVVVVKVVKVYNIFSIAMLAAPVPIALYYAYRTIVLSAFVKRGEVRKRRETPHEELVMIDSVGTAFSKVVDIVARIYGVVLEKSDTLREYLLKLRGKVPSSMYSLLNSIVKLMELYLYGRPEKREGIASRIIELARWLLRSLKGG